MKISHIFKMEALKHEVVINGEIISFTSCNLNFLSIYSRVV